MRIGVNLPWVRCGHDFGPGPPAWGPTSGPRDFSEVERELTGLRALGVDLTRFFVLAGGVNYPVGEDPRAVATLAPMHEGPLHAVARALFGARKDEPGLRGGPLAPTPLRALARASGRAYEELRLHVGRRPPPLPDAFVTDFRALLRACARSGVRAIPSLVSFELFQPARVRADGVVLRGRRSFVFGVDERDRSARRAHVEAFLDATLSPLLEASRDHRDAIYAFELVNEPEWAVTTGPVQLDPSAYGVVPSLPTVTPDAMSDFVLAGVDRIARAGFVATVGFGDPAARWLDARALAHLRALAREGRYVHQRHHYPTLLGARTLPPHDASPITPCILGEIPTAMGRARPDNVRWRDTELRATEGDRSRYLEARIALARDRGYPAALLWSLRSTDPRKAWDDARARQVEAAARHDGKLA